ncbi:hypothetical protein FACS1894170_01820 [Planctomycetales bacterium]|nr:hypothetical protein FACS1894170_01820 [Planctomycetales bacterium]
METSSQFSPPAAPQIRKVETTDTSVKLTWDAQKKLTGYELQYRKHGTDEWTPWTPPDKNDTEATIGGLTIDTKYDFKLTAINTDYKGPEPTEATTEMTASTQPDTPVLKVAGETYNSVTLKWTKQDNWSGYTLQYSSDGGENWEDVSITIPADAEECTVLGLNPSTLYKFKLTAKGSNGGSADSEPVNATTLGVAPDEPTGFTQTNVTENSVTLSWNEQSDVKGYVVQYRRTSDTNWTKYVTPGNESDEFSTTATSITVSGLVSNTTYEFQLLAINDDGQSATRLPQTVTTNGAKPDKPEHFSVDATTTSSITLTWTGQSGLNGYTLEYKASSDSTWHVYINSPSAAATSVTVNGLKSATKYEFRLTAKNNQGDSEKAYLEEDAKTKPAAADMVAGQYQSPDSVSAEVTTDKESTSVTVKWTASPNAPPSAVYVVQYRVYGTTKWKSVTVKGGELEKELKLASGKTYEFQVYAKGEKNGMVQSEATGAKQKMVSTWAVLKAASLAAPKATELPDGFKSQEQIAVKVKNFSGNALSSALVDTLKVCYTDKANGVKTEVVLKLSSDGWKSDGDVGNVTFENGIIVISGLPWSHKYKVDVQFSMNKSATSKKPTTKTFSTTKANWSSPVSNIQQTASGSGVTWDPAKDDKGTLATDYTVKAYIWTGTKYKVAKKVTVKSVNTISFANLKPGTYFVTVTANKNTDHVAGIEAEVSNSSPTVVVV